MGAKPIVPLELRAVESADPGAIERTASVGRDLRSGGRLNAAKCSKVPPGASGSSTRTAMLLVLGGTADQESGGATPLPSQVYSDGIFPPLSNADEVTLIVPSSARPTNAKSMVTAPQIAPMVRIDHLRRARLRLGRTVATPHVTRRRLRPLRAAPRRCRAARTPPLRPAWHRPLRPPRRRRSASAGDRAPTRRTRRHRR